MNFLKTTSSNKDTLQKNIITFDKNIKQRELFKLIHGPATYILAVGGARSGKTLAYVSEMVGVGYQFPGTRQLIARFRYKHAKQYIYRDTLKKVLAQYDENTYNIVKTDPIIIQFFNGSEIYLGGLDTPERIDDLLGAEYCRILLNESSQISYRTFDAAKSRLAQNIPGLQNKILLDLNPTWIKHWTNQLFINKIDPMTREPVLFPEDYAYIFINPEDNKAYLPESYFKILQSMTEADQERFLFGRYQKLIGGVYKNFDPLKHTVNYEAIIDPCESYAVGVDLITYAAVLCGYSGNTVYAIDECGDNDEFDKLTAQQMNDLIWERWGKYKPILYIDHNLGEEGLTIFRNSKLADKGPGSVEYGVNYINQLIDSDNFRISNRCLKTQYDIENYRRNPDTGILVKKDNHFGDALRYNIASHGKNMITNIGDLVGAYTVPGGFDY